MLTGAAMGGMDEMSIFYDICLEGLYPPGQCGTYCSGHTFNCFLSEVHATCCDEAGHNCPEGAAVPLTCPVGCALTFPDFVETCRDHIAATEGLELSAFEAFEAECFDVDGLALVEYAISLQARGCLIDLTGRHRRLQYLAQWLGSAQQGCEWDDVNDIVQDVDSICCAANACASSGTPSSCAPPCAVAMHQFMQRCGEVVGQVLGPQDPRFADMQRFDSSCLESADPHFFYDAIRAAECPDEGSPPAISPGSGSSGGEPPGVKDSLGFLKEYSGSWFTGTGVRSPLQRSKIF